jgi:hypothetical protein
MRMCHIVICPLSCSTIFSTLSYKRHDFRKKKKCLNKKCVLTFSTNFVRKNLILRGIGRDIVTMAYRSSCKVPVIPVRFQWNFNFFNKFSEKKTQMSNFIQKSVQWEPSCSIRTDRRTDMTKLIVAFRNFAKLFKNGIINTVIIKVHRINKITSFWHVTSCSLVLCYVRLFYKTCCLL